MQLLHEADDCFCLSPLVGYLCHLHHELFTDHRQQLHLTRVVTGKIVSCTYIIISRMATNGVHHSRLQLHDMNAALVPMPGSIAGDTHAIAVAKATCSQQASAKHASHSKASVKTCHGVCKSMVVNDICSMRDNLSTALHVFVKLLKQCTWIWGPSFCRGFRITRSGVTPVLRMLFRTPSAPLST